MKISEAGVKPSTGSNGPSTVRTIIGAVAFIAMVLSFAPGASAKPADSAQRAAAGAAWLTSQLEDGIPIEQWGSPDWGITIEAASALAAADATNPKITAVWDALVADRDNVVAKGGADVPGTLAKVILLAHSIDKNPRAVGTAPGADLVQRLVDTMQGSGLYGSQSPNYDGVYRQGLALAALASAGVSPDERAVSWLVDQQCTNDAFDGAFVPFRSDTSVPCSDDPESWFGADTNATALAITGLNAAAKGNAGADGSVAKALSWLASVQKDADGWAANSWSPVDPNSTAVVIQALIATGHLDDDDLNGEGGGPLAALGGFQSDKQGDGEQSAGWFFFPGMEGPNVMATVQAVPALASKPLIFKAVSSPTTPTTSTPTTSVPTTTAPPTSTTTTVAEVKGVTSVAGNTGAAAAGVNERPISFTG